MDEWEVIVERYEGVERKSFLKACQCAHDVIKDDLAPSEIVWFLDTLLLEPVNLLTTIAGKWTDCVWLDVIGKAFKVLSSVIEKYPEESSQHFENITMLCEKPFDARTRAYAIQCLTSVVPHCEDAAQNYRRHLCSLENDKTCKAAVAELIGAICAHYPDLVKGCKDTIWRVYLNLLDARHSDTVERSLLLGVAGLLSSFGNHLPISEFKIFYGHLLAARDKYRCKEVYLTVLTKHADLFRELLAEDPGSRASLWQTFPAQDPEGRTRRAILAVYSAVKQHVSDATFKTMVTKEAALYQECSNTQLKYTALRVLHAAGTLAPRAHLHAHALEHAVRHAHVTYEHAEAIQWCLEYKNDSRLLKSALVFHDHIPAKYRKEITVHGLLKAPSHVRTMAVIFLTNETCQHYKENGNIDKFLPLWKSFFDRNDEVVLERCGLVFLDFMEYLLQTLEHYKDVDFEELPEKLYCLVSISSYIIPLGECIRSGGGRLLTRVSEVSRAVQQLLARGRGAGGAAAGAALRAARLLMPYGATGYLDIVTDVCLEQCLEDAALYETCLALALTPPARVKHVSSVLQALQIICSRSDVEQSVLSRCVTTLDGLISCRRDELDNNLLNNVIRRLEDIQPRVEYKGKDGRCLRRDLLMFLGKYGRHDGYGDEDMGEGVHLEKYLTLGVPVVSEGIILKINLQEIHCIALRYEEPKTLQVLVDLLYANLSGRVLPESASRALCRSACALLRARPQLRTRVFTACGHTSLTILLQFVENERSKSVRVAACAALRQVAQHSELARAALRGSAHLCSSNKPAFLDIAILLMEIMRDDNTLAQNYLLDLMKKISEINLTHANTVLKLAIDLFIDKIELFRNVLPKIEIELLEVVLRTQDGGDVYKMADVHVLGNRIKLTLDFLKQLFEYTEKDYYSIIKHVFVIKKENGVDISRLLCVLSSARQVFDFDENMCHRVLEEDNFVGKLFMAENLDCVCLESILKFCDEYAGVLSETHREKTLKVISKLLSKLKPEKVIQQARNLSSCIKKYETLLKDIPQDFIEGFSDWCKEQNIQKIGSNLEKDVFDEVDIELVHSLRILLDLCNLKHAVYVDLEKETKIWLFHFQEYYKNGYLKKVYLPYFTDLLHIIFKFLSPMETKSVVMMEGFCEEFMPVVFGHLIEKPYSAMKELLHRKDLLKFLVKYTKRCKVECCDDVLDMIDQLWPDYEKVSSLEEQHSLLVETAGLPKVLPPESNPMRWLVKSLRSDRSTCEMRAMLIGLLPPGEPYKSTWSWFAGLLPARLAEARGESGLLLGALLEALLAADCGLLESISQLVAGDTAEGWWDDAIEACMTSLAKRDDLSVYETVYECCWRGVSLGVCRRLMVPLLRNSSASVCEEFFSRKLKGLLSVLKRRPRQMGSDMTFPYHKAVVDYTRALILLRVAIEMIPRSHIESPRSLLYSHMGVEVPVFHLTRCLAMCSVDLVNARVVTCPPHADDKLKNSCLLFHCENYNSLAAAIWCRQPADPKFYDHVFSRDTWRRIVDPDLEYRLPLTESWQKRTVNQSPGVELDTSSGLLSRTSSVRTRTFLHTLSENPDDFDKGVAQDDQEFRQEMCVSANVLNQHPCAGTLSASLSRAARLPHAAWRAALRAALLAAPPAARNLQWLLAQAICNCKEDLKTHASALRPALLAMITQTSEEELNSLHMDVVDTIIFWRDEEDLPPEAVVSLNAVLQRLITTSVSYRRKKTIVYSVVQKMSSLLEMFGPVARVDWTCLQQYVEVKNEELAQTFIEILRAITKKIHIPELLSALLQTLEIKSDKLSSSRPQLAAVCGRALLVAPPGDRVRALAGYRRVLEMYKSHVGEYIELVLHAQRECQDICNAEIFGRIADHLPKMIDRNRKKCLEILSLAVSRASCGDVNALFQSREVGKLVDEGDSGALVLVGRGLLRLGRGLTPVGRGLVLLSVKHCRSDVKKVREAACSVLKSAVECLFFDATESSPKRAARFSSPLLQDEELKVALAALGLALSSDDGLRDSVSRCLPTAGIATRFCECFILTVYLPVVYERQGSVSCLTAFLDIFFKDLRENEAFKRNLIADHPFNDDTVPTTVSSATTHGNNIQNEDPVEETKTVDDVLRTILQFCKSSVEAASALCLQLLTASQSIPGSGFDFPAALAGLLSAMLPHVSDLTPFLVQACRLFIDECCALDGFKQAVEDLLKSVKSTEGEQMVQVLLEDVEIRLSGYKYFILGSTNKILEDIEMSDLSREFSLEEMVAAFDSLSDWQLLTLQQQRSAADRLPPLWTTVTDFRTQLEGWQLNSSNTWFDRMSSVYHKKTYKSLQWFAELSRWPRRQFRTSATIDALELKSMQDEEHPRELSCDIQPRDCLVEWAARIMTRSACIEAMYQNMEEGVTRVGSSRSHALRWCARANEMALPAQVLRCLQTVDKQESAAPRWVRQELLARRHLALQTSRVDTLSELLDRAETVSSLQVAPLEDVVGMNHLNLMLRRDLKSLNKEKLKVVLNNTRQQISEATEGRLKEENRQVLKGMVQLAVTHYDEMWPGANDTEQSELLTEMSDVLSVGIDWNLGLDYSVMMDVVLYRLGCYSGDRLAAGPSGAVLGKVETLIHVLDDFAIEELKRNQRKFSSVPCELASKLSRKEEVTGRFKECLQLVADPKHALRHYIKELVKALEEDGVVWEMSLDRTERKIFGNPYAGVDYQVLNRYRTALYGIQFNTDDKESIKQTLLDLMKELNTQSESLKLSQLCPFLTRADSLSGSETEECLSRLLMLPRGVRVLKFEEQVSVFADSKRRPAVVTVLLSDGSRRRLLVKCGEALAVDAAALRMLRALQLPSQDYRVTVLSEDSGLIEFLEEHARLRAAIASKYDIKNAESARVGEQLALDSREHSVAQFQQTCDSCKIPAYAFRSVMEHGSSSFQEFISKKQKYEESFAAMTYATSLLGLKDRHLENIMYSPVTGSVRAVDWNSALRHAHHEPPPARLTRCLLAPCRVTVLESRLQQLTLQTRRSQRLLQAALHVSFQRLPGDMQHELKDVGDLMRGSALPHQVTARGRRRSPGDRAALALALILDQIFQDFEHKEVYSVEEQVTGLLRHCTDPQILAVTRSAWEPWI